MPSDEYYPQPQMDEAAASESDSGGADETSETPATETALIPKSILGGKEFEVGDEVVLKIVSMHDDEVEVSYAPEKPKSRKAMDDAEDSLGKMAMGG